MSDTPPQGAGATAVHFGGLTELRAVAAFAVVFTHIEALRARWGLASFADHPLLAHLGTHGVLLFFCLSGFLITWLLQEESIRSGRVDVPRFYARRALRIWPLYFLVALSGLTWCAWLLPAPGFVAVGDVAHTAYPWLLLVMLPNVALAGYGSVMGLSPLWSVGVEEQFYLVWPWLVRFAKARIGALLTALVVGAVLLRVALWAALPPESALAGPARVLMAVGRLFALECLAGGALLAVWLRRHPHLLLRLSNPLAAGGLFGAGLAWAWMADPFGPLFNLVSSAIWVGVLAATLALGSSRRRWGRVLRRLGEVSYGIYLYHMFVVSAVLWILHGDRATPGGPVEHLATYAMVCLATFLVAEASFRTIEAPLLRLKGRFAVVRSRAAD